MSFAGAWHCWICQENHNYFSPITRRICKCSIWQNSVFFRHPVPFPESLWWKFSVPDKSDWDAPFHFFTFHNSFLCNDLLIWKKDIAKDFHLSTNSNLINGRGFASKSVPLPKSSFLPPWPKIDYDFKKFAKYLIRNIWVWAHSPIQRQDLISQIWRFQKFISLSTPHLKNHHHGSPAQLAEHSCNEFHPELFSHTALIFLWHLRQKFCI